MAKSKLTANQLKFVDNNQIEHTVIDLEKQDIITKFPFVDVRAYGAKGDGVYDDSQALQQALTEIGTKEATLLIASPLYIKSNITIPENINLKFIKGGKLVVDNGVTITINSSIDAGLYQIFDGEGLVTGNPKIKEAYPEWFGAKGDGVHDDTLAIQKAVDFYFTVFKQNYLITNQIIIKRNVKFEGGKIIVNPISGNISYILIQETNYGDLLKMEGMTILGSGTYQLGVKTANCNGVEVIGDVQVVFYDLNVENFDKGVILNNNLGHIYFYNPMITKNYYGVYVEKNSSDYLFVGGMVDGNSFANIACGFEGIDSLTILHTHIGHAPYGIYQEQTDGSVNHAGLTDITLIKARFEAIGNGAIITDKANSTSRNIYINSIGFSYSSSYTYGTVEDYAIWFDILQGGNSEIRGDIANLGVGAIYIDHLAENLKLVGNFSFNSLDSGYVNIASREDRAHITSVNTNGGSVLVPSGSTAYTVSFPIAKLCDPAKCVIVLTPEGTGGVAPYMYITDITDDGFTINFDNALTSDLVVRYKIIPFSA